MKHTNMSAPHNPKTRLSVLKSKCVPMFIIMLAMMVSCAGGDQSEAIPEMETTSFVPGSSTQPAPTTGACIPEPYPGRSMTLAAAEIELSKDTGWMWDRHYVGTSDQKQHIHRFIFMTDAQGNKTGVNKYLVRDIGQGGFRDEFHTIRNVTSWELKDSQEPGYLEIQLDYDDGTSGFIYKIKIFWDQTAYKLQSNACSTIFTYERQP